MKITQIGPHNKRNIVLNKNLCNSKISFQNKNNFENISSTSKIFLPLTLICAMLFAGIFTYLLEKIANRDKLKPSNRHQ